ncbi:MAG: M48 family metallopeptidase [Bryobacteraceae bacterium]|nr:M48 family metallopeptidase [Bryobacteraceae bacterium]
MTPTVWTGQYYDGRSAARHDVTVTFEEQYACVRPAHGDPFPIPVASLRLTAGLLETEPVTWEIGSGPARLVIADRAVLAEAPPVLSRALKAERAPLPALLGLSGAVAAAILAFLWFLPALAEKGAGFIPWSWEERLGATASALEFGKLDICEDAALRGVLDAAVNRLAPRSPYPIRVRLVSSPMVNAFALPGGEIFIFAGLWNRIRTPEELAALLSHEIQHVERRHATKAIARELSTSALIGLAVGDATAARSVMETMGTLRALRYRRDDEEDADRRGLEAMMQAGIHPRGMVELFENLQQVAQDMPEGLVYVSTHPSTAARAALIRRESARFAGAGEPLVSERMWREARAACR